MMRALIGTVVLCWLSPAFAEWTYLDHPRRCMAVGKVSEGYYYRLVVSRDIKSDTVELVGTRTFRTIGREYVRPEILQAAWYRIDEGPWTELIGTEFTWFPNSNPEDKYPSWKIGAGFLDRLKRGNKIELFYEHSRGSDRHSVSLIGFTKAWKNCE